MGATREKKVHTELSEHAHLIKYSQLVRKSQCHSLMATTVNRGWGQWCFHTNRSHPTPNGETTFFVLNGIGINKNKLACKINMQNSP